MVRCSSCDFEFRDDPQVPRVPCPGCGGMARTFDVIVQGTVDVIGTTDFAHVVIGGSADVLAAATLESAAHTVAPRSKRDWFETVTAFLPKTIREPWAGDVLEDREKWASNGRSRLSIEFRTVTQVLVLILSWIWTNLRWILDLLNLLH